MTSNLTCQTCFFVSFKATDYSKFSMRKGGPITSMHQQIDKLQAHPIPQQRLRPTIQFPRLKGKEKPGSISFWRKGIKEMDRGSAEVPIY